MSLLGLPFQCCNLPKMSPHLPTVFHCFLVFIPFAHTEAILCSTLVLALRSSVSAFIARKSQESTKHFWLVFLSFPQLHQTLSCWHGKHPQASGLKRWKSCRGQKGEVNIFVCLISTVTFSLHPSLFGYYSHSSLQERHKMAQCFPWHYLQSGSSDHHILTWCRSQAAGCSKFLV